MNRRHFLRATGLASAGFLGGLAEPLRSRTLGASRTGSWSFIHYTDVHVQPELRAEEGFRQAVKAMNDLMAHDSTFIRPYVLAGRLLLTLKQKDAVLSKLDTAVTLNPKHELAQALIDQERGK